MVVWTSANRGMLRQRLAEHGSPLSKYLLSPLAGPGPAQGVRGALASTDATDLAVLEHSAKMGC